MKTNWEAARATIRNNRFYTGIGILIGLGLITLLAVANVRAHEKYRQSLDNPVQSDELEIVDESRFG